MKPPIGMIGSNDTYVFPTVENAENDIEAQDLWNSFYSVYDSETQLLNICVGYKEIEGRIL